MTVTQTFATYHPVLQAIALNMVGSLEDAEDIVQDTFLKWLSVEHEKIQNTKSYLIRAVTNNCINHLENINRIKKEYIENASFSEVLKSDKDHTIFNFDVENQLSEAMAILHTKLEPMEKTIYVLREAFNLEYEELQEILDKKKENCRQLFCRAKKNLAKEAQKFSFDFSIHQSHLEEFKKACAKGISSDFINELKQEFTFSKKK